MTLADPPTTTAPGAVPTGAGPGGAVPTGTPLRLAEHLVDGRTVPAGGTREVHRLNPCTGELSAVLVPATADEVASAVEAAHGAGPAWRRTAPTERAAALQAAAAVIRDRAAELGAALTASTGRLLTQATGSALVAASIFEEAAVTGLGPTGRTLAGGHGALDVVRREPHGVVAVVTPWNDPFPAAAALLAAALVTGNTVVHKPSERSAVPGWELARIVADALPPGVLDVINGDGGTGSALVADERVRLVAHVGSSATGRRIASVVGARGGRVLLENGGKDPIVVDAGVDARWAAEQIAVGAFTNTGQLCTSVERVYLHQDIADAVLEALVDTARGMTTGAPEDPATDLGPLVDREQVQVVDGHVRDAVAAGARVLAGGEPGRGSGCFYPATVLDACTDEMDLLREETFGPVAAVVRVAGFEEGVRRAGAGRYGLAATVLTPDLGRALAAAEELEVGTVKINAVFGGAPGGSADPRRDSGSGAGYGPDLLAAMTVLKAVHLEPARTTPA